MSDMIYLTRETGERFVQFTSTEHIKFLSLKHDKTSELGNIYKT